MALTKIDLKKIKNLLAEERKEILQQMFMHFVTKEELDGIFDKKLEPIKKDLNQLRDDYAGIRKELDTEHEIRRKHIDENTKRGINNRKRVIKIEQVLEISSYNRL